MLKNIILVAAIAISTFSIALSPPIFDYAYQVDFNHTQSQGGKAIKITGKLFYDGVNAK